MRLKNLRSISVKNKRVLVRVDFNVPIKNSRIMDEARLKAALPTIRYLTSGGAKLILISHLDEPTKKSRQNSLRPIYQHLKRIGLKIKFIDDCLGSKVRKAVDELKNGEILLLENLRFYSGEKNNDLKFARQLSQLADIFVNDAFSVCHRAHASVSAISKFLPSYAGFCLEKEVAAISEILDKTKYPLIVVMGGAKVSTKIGAIENLSQRADKILIGGALANNFLKAKGDQIGQSKYEPQMINTAVKLMKNKRIILPTDVRIKSKTTRKNVKLAELGDLRDFEILDIGLGTTRLFTNYLKSAKMIVWNGPMGYFEDKRFAAGTKKVVRAILANKKAKIVLGGGETLSCLRMVKSRFQIPDSRFWISTAGGAMLEFLANKPMPGLKSLIKKF